METTDQQTETAVDETTAQTIETVTKAFSTDIKIGDEERSVTAKISTSAIDRDGEVLLPQGANFKEFEKNPVVFFGHEHNTLPIGKCVAIKRDDKAIYAKTVFAARPDGYPVDKEWLPDTVFSLYKQGVLNGFSVGFVPIETRPATKADEKNYGEGVKRIYSKWKVLEYSAVPIPANQEAVATAVSKGFLSVNHAREWFGVEDVKVKCSFKLPPSEAEVAKSKQRGKVYYIV